MPIAHNNACSRSSWRHNAGGTRMPPARPRPLAPRWCSGRLLGELRRGFWEAYKLSSPLNGAGRKARQAPPQRRPSTQGNVPAFDGGGAPASACNSPAIQASGTRRMRSEGMPRPAGPKEPAFLTAGSRKRASLRMRQGTGWSCQRRADRRWSPGSRQASGKAGGSLRLRPRLRSPPRLRSSKASPPPTRRANATRRLNRQPFEALRLEGEARSRASLARPACRPEAAWHSPRSQRRRRGPAQRRRNERRSFGGYCS
jgi:hypothetical protein